MTALSSIDAPLRIVVAGHVDHGKSTLIGRLLYDTGSLPEGKFNELQAICEKRGMPLEWSFVLDAFQAERDQAITIDTTQIWFKTQRRDYVIIDAPGHREFLKNMISGAALADAAVLVIDAEEGIRDQSRRHAYLLSLLGLKQVVVVVNKMDRIEFSQFRFRAIENEIRQYLDSIGLPAGMVIPIAAREGDNLVTASANTSWYVGPTLVTALDQFAAPAPLTDRPLRLPIQDVYHFDHRRILVGRVESGTLRVGDELIFSPTNRSARVKTIEHWGRGAAPLSVPAGRPVGFTLDEQIFAERGDVATHRTDQPILAHEMKARIFWLGHQPLEVGQHLKAKLATDEADVRIEAITTVVDTDTLDGRPAAQVERNQVAEVMLRSRELLAVDDHRQHPSTGRIVLVDGFDTVGGGILLTDGMVDHRTHGTVKATNIYAVDHILTPEIRAQRNGHVGGVFWFTGLSGAGKSTLAMRVEQSLFAKGMQVYVLDGDNVRRGLNADLGFSPDDRSENIRRIGEAAALFADAGIIVITAFISPYRDDRLRARQAASRTQFHEIYVKADLATCEQRDPKNLYKRARAGEIPEFTGISAPYEEPEAAEMIVDTDALSLERCVDVTVDYILARVRLAGRTRLRTVSG